ncbi:MAG: CheR family methyltransferase [Desulfobacterales bacterium]|nr:CheR family methyltransferase [Desulfobacterales bacterium]
MDDPQFHRLLDYFGYSPEGYRRVRKGVKKRLRRHMQALGCTRLECYLDAVAASPRTRRACLQCLSVPISRFMRDAAFWETLVQQILPDLMRRFGVPLAVWSAGCACGEEVYSLVISAREVQPPMNPERPLLDILATDRNPVFLSRARDGIYPRSSFRELSAEQLTRHFNPLPGRRRFRIRRELQTGVNWLCCDIESLPSTARFHLVLLRNNILTYCDQAGREQGLRRTLAHLRPGGVLVIGSRERLPGAAGGLDPAFGLSYVFERYAETPLTGC